MITNMNENLEIIDNHFNAYKSLLYDINTKTMELRKLKEDYYNVSGVRYDDVRIQGGTPYDIADQLHLIVEKEKSLKAKINYKEELRRIHEEEINKANKNRKRTIMKLYYLDQCTTRQIASCLKISDGHVKKLKRWAVEEFINTIIKVKENG